MRAAYIIFDDDEFKKINAVRKKMTWRRFVLKAAGLPYDVRKWVNPKPYITKLQLRAR